MLNFFLFVFARMLARINCPLPKHELIPGSFELIHADFIKRYPKKSLKELKKCLKSSLFAVLARVVEISQVDQRWYPVCDCRKVVSVLFGTYYCLDCRKSIFRVGSK